MYIIKKNIKSDTFTFCQILKCLHISPALPLVKWLIYGGGNIFMIASHFYKAINKNCQKKCMCKLQGWTTLGILGLIGRDINIFFQNPYMWWDEGFLGSLFPMMPSHDCAKRRKFCLLSRFYPYKMSFIEYK